MEATERRRGQSMIELPRADNYGPSDDGEHGTAYYTATTVRRLIAEAVEKEREACAIHACDFLTQGRSPLGRRVAEAIRARAKEASDG